MPPLNVQGPRISGGANKSGVTQVITSTSAPSTATALPQTNNARNPRVCRLVSTNPVLVKFGTNGGDCTPTLNDIMVTSNPDYVSTLGYSVFEAILHTTNAATAILNIQAVE